VVQQCDDRSATFGSRLTVRSTVSKLSSRGDTCAHVQRARRSDRLELLPRHSNCSTGEQPAHRDTEHPVRPEEGRCSLLPYPFAVIGFLSRVTGGSACWLGSARRAMERVMGGDRWVRRQTRQVATLIAPPAMMS